MKKSVFLLFAMFAVAASFLFTSCDQANNPDMVSSVEAGIDVPQFSTHDSLLCFHVQGHADVNPTHVLDSLKKGFTFGNQWNTFHVQMDSLGHFTFSDDACVKFKMGVSTKPAN